MTRIILLVKLVTWGGFEDILTSFYSSRMWVMALSTQRASVTFPLWPKRLPLCAILAVQTHDNVRNICWFANQDKVPWPLAILPSMHNGFYAVTTNTHSILTHCYYVEACLNRCWIFRSFCTSIRKAFTQSQIPVLNVSVHYQIQKINTGSHNGLDTETSKVRYTVDEN